MRTITLILLALSVLLWVGCTNEAKKPPPLAVLHIVTTTGMLADAVQHVVGEYATVEALMGPGVDPHLQ